MIFRDQQSLHARVPTAAQEMDMQDRLSIVGIGLVMLGGAVRR
jgi:hypothetical protein